MFQHATITYYLCVFVCVPVSDTYPAKVLNGFGWYFAQGGRSIPDTASRFLVSIAPGVPPGSRNDLLRSTVLLFGSRCFILVR